MNSYLTSKELSIITVNDIQRYLVRRGFKNEGLDKLGKNQRFTKYFDSINKFVTLPIPVSEDFTDYLSRIDTIISALATFFESDYQIIYNELTRSIKDIMRMRVLNPGQYNHSLPLDYAAREIDAIKEMFLYSACSEVIELPYFDHPLSEGLKHIQNCQFGHTFEGSFGFSINIPIIKNDQILLIDESVEIPYERKVTERIMRGLAIVEKASKENSSDLIVSTFERGLNAKMCDSLLSMSIDKTKEIEVQTDWSLEYQPDQDVVELQKIKITKKEFEIIEDASIRLKRVEPFEQVIIGNVITLHSKNDPNLEEDFLRTIAMRHEHEGRSVEVKIYLNRSDYLIAYQAHGAGRKIEVRGKLFRTGSTWKMNEVSDVKFYT